MQYGRQHICKMHSTTYQKVKPRWWCDLQFEGRNIFWEMRQKGIVLGGYCMGMDWALVPGQLTTWWHIMCRGTWLPLRVHEACRVGGRDVLIYGKGGGWWGVNYETQAHPDFGNTQGPRIVPPPQGAGGCWTATYPTTHPATKAVHATIHPPTCIHPCREAISTHTPKKRPTPSCCLPL